MNLKPHYVLLHQAIYDALMAQEDREVALAAAQRLDDGRFRIMTSFNGMADGAVDPASLYYCVEIEDADGEFVPLCRVHWTRLGLTARQVIDEYRVTMLQNGVGIPDDVSSLLRDDASSDE